MSEDERVTEPEVRMACLHMAKEIAMDGASVETIILTAQKLADFALQPSKEAPCTPTKFFDDKSRYQNISPQQKAEWWR